MNLKDYKILKEKKAKLKEEEELLFRKLCLKCLRPLKACICKDIKPINTKSKFVILIHPMEAKKEKVATGRLAHLCLENSKLVMGIDFSNNIEVNEIINNEKYLPYLLYPGEGSHNITKSALTEITIERNIDKIPIFFIIDATWPHAKSMMKKSKNLHMLKRVSFEYSGISQFSIKQQPNKNCLCTIESIYYLIDGLIKYHHEEIEGNEHSLLLKKLADLVKYQIDCTLDPNLKSYRRGKYTLPEDRPYSKKWKGRSVCYEGKNHLDDRDK